MMKLVITSMMLCLTLGAAAQNSEQELPKLSPLTRMIVKDIEKAGSNTIPAGYMHRTINGKAFVSGLVKVANSKAANVAMENLGVHVGTRAGDIWTVQVPADKIIAFTKTGGISYIQIDEPLRPTMSQARRKTLVDSVHKAVDLPWPMTGLGVVMGVIDFGFDYGHPAWYDGQGNNYRVKKVWELNTNGTPPTGYSYGHELVGAAAIQAQGTDNAVQTHGTGVAGIAAGSGLGTPNLSQKGVAYDAEMVFVGVRRDSIGDQWRSSSFTDFIDGVNYIFSYADDVNKPAVTNISWGSQSGPHDGTSLFCQACDNLSGEGKMIVMSAGNDGQENIHISRTFTPTDSIVNTYVTFSDDTLQRTWIDIWGDTSETFCAEVTLYNNGIAGNSTGYICIDDNLHELYVLANSGQDTCYIDFITSSSEYNSKPRMTLDIHNRSDDSIHISVKGTSGSIDMWNEYYYYGYKYGYSSVFENLGDPDAVDGNTASTVSDMGSAESVLLVGAYASKTNWSDFNNNPWSYSSYVTTGDIVPFSSRGPMADGRISPDITAPGLTLQTAISSFDTRYTPTGLNKQQVVSSTNFNSKTYYYAEFTGTSASAPMASGIVALMLQANPRLTPQQVKTMIGNTAIQDNFTGTLPAAGTNTWGKGKINAWEAVKAAHQANSIYEFKGEELDCVLYPTPNDGSCSIFYNAKANEQLTIKVTDITGRTTHAEQWNVTIGDNVKKLALNNIPGIYTVNIASAKGSVGIKTEVR